MTAPSTFLQPYIPVVIKANNYILHRTYCGDHTQYHVL